MATPGMSYEPIDMEKLTLRSGQTSEFILETLSLFREELDQAKFTLANWQVGSNKHTIQQLLWCLRGSCASFGAYQLKSELESAHHSLNSAVFMGDDSVVSPAFEVVLRTIEYTLQDLDTLGFQASSCPL